MACPFFVPLDRVGEAKWSVAPRAPLGALWFGECHAGAEIAAANHELCNFGYARGACPRFPEAAATDAVRFWRTASGVMFVRECAHVPVEWGLVQEHDGVLATQARVFDGEMPPT